MKAQIFSVLCALCVLSAGCSLTVDIIDRSGFEISVRQASVEPYGYFTILAGESIWKVPLKNIDRIQIDSLDILTRSEGMFVAAKIYTRSGELTPPRDVNNPLIPHYPKMYVRAGEEIRGSTKTGNFAIAIDKISNLTLHK